MKQLQFALQPTLKNISVDWKNLPVQTCNKEIEETRKVMMEFEWTFK